MNNDNNFTTPKQAKRLGLRRNHSVLKETSSSKISTSVLTKTTFSTPSRLPQSDIRVNYRNLERNEEDGKQNVLSTPGTPKTTASVLAKQRQAVSTNCRPYRLSLSRKVREKMTKKRLEFHLANELEKEETDEEDDRQHLRADTNTTNQASACKNQLDIKEKQENEDKESSAELFEGMSKHELMSKIEICRKELADRLNHAKKVNELKQAIYIWKTGFSSALNDLQQKIEPRLDTETLLQQLRIPQDMLKYVND